MSTTRYVYNKTVQAIRDGHKIDKYELRDKLVTIKNNDTIQDWEKLTPKLVREGAVNDVVKAYKTAFTQLRNGTIDHFRIGFKKKKDKNESIVVPKSAIKVINDKLVIYPTYFTENLKVDNEIDYTNPDILFYAKETIPSIDHDCRLLYQKHNYYLAIPVPLSYHPVQNKYDIVSGDLGVRTFLTTFNNREIIEFKRDKALLERLHKKIDGMKSQRKSNKSISKTEKRLSNIIDDLHWRTITYLTRNYNNIVMGKLESQKCVKRCTYSKVNRMMNSLKLYQFLERLKFKCKEQRCNFVLVHEAYTSQTCCNCGELTKTLSKTFICSSCNLVMDRDVLGARNILTKFLATEPVLIR